MCEGDSDAVCEEDSDAVCEGDSDAVCERDSDAVCEGTLPRRESCTAVGGHGGGGDPNWCGVTCRERPEPRAATLGTRR